MKKIVKEPTVSLEVSSPVSAEIMRSAPADLIKFQPINALTKEDQKRESVFLPYAFLSNAKTPDVPPWRLILKTEKTEVLEAPFLLSHLATWPMVRLLEGSQYTTRAYPTKDQRFPGASVETFEKISKALKDGGEVDGQWTSGYVHLLALIRGEEAVILTIEAAGTLEGYWSGCLPDGDIRAKKAVRVTCSSHERNVVTSERGFEYLASWKFKQWEICDLTEPQYIAVQRAFQHQEKQIENFLKK